MPIYEYQCGECGTRTEAIQRLDEEPLTECPSCGGPLAKLLSAPAFQFKGTGWYVTDYADKGKKTGQQDGSGDSEKDSASKAEDKSSPASSGSSAKDSSGSAKSSGSSSSGSSQG